MQPIGFEVPLEYHTQLLNAVQPNLRKPTADY